MPPSVKFTKEEIVNAALQVVREKGTAALTTRQIAAVLGVSTRPIFTYFQNMQQVQEAVRQAAQALYHSYIKKGLEQVHPFIGLGEQYIRFATQEPELYRLLFLPLAPGSENKAMEEMERTQNLVLEFLQQIYQLDEAAAKRFFRDVWLVAHSLAALIVTNCCPYSPEEIRQILTSVSLSVCKACKEIPEFVTNHLDKDTLFRSIIEKE
ncbi:MULTISPECIES: TetR/AcrR family transcriptional regulator [Ruminococcus]|uniref:TetR/AcrR family transcriptional regulator n=1 Tax=Ruminococcus TaxID=1263 RepID=UPI00033A1245|nr:MULTISPECIES: TetR/AcrR family transcriptional regulator [Ruminococcus]CDD53296.1 transcriptional regulator [Ruminococcus sp. CAG:379]